jgi:peptidoglycan/LPS O-acetylase OafA/YrhL
MTDESQPQPDEAPPSEPATPTAFSAAKASLDGAERMIALGALLLLVGVYLVGDVILDEWGLDMVTWSASLGSLALMYQVKTKGRSVPIPYTFSLKTLSYLVGALGVAEVLWFIEGGRADGIEILFALAYFVGVIAMVMGARKLTD